MKIVKTNLGKKAPPPQRGVSKALYETVEAFSIATIGLLS